MRRAELRNAAPRLKPGAPQRGARIGAHPNAAMALGAARACGASLLRRRQGICNVRRYGAGRCAPPAT
jgi:hypothetical protein